MSVPTSVAPFLGLQFDQLDERGAVATVRELAGRGPFAYVVTPNVDHLVRLHRQRDNAPLWASYAGASLCLCDSRVLKALARLSGERLEVVPGSDLTARILGSAGEWPSAAVIGGDETLISNLRALYPTLTWHWHAPPQNVLRDREAQLEIIEFVEGCPAGLYFFAIGSPQSELVCAEITLRRRAQGVGLCVGASLEFLTGAKTRAPLWIQRAGLEWLFRLTSEPSRLWRRYLVDGPRIFVIWWRWRVSPPR